MKLIDLLKEIGDATARPYDWSQTADEEDFKQYLFQTDSDLKYELEISVSEGDKELDSAVVAFGIVEAGEEDYFTDYDKVPSKGELYKVMATTVSILKDFIKKNKQIKYIYFTTNKLGNDTSKDRSSRLGLYTKYIQKHIPNAKIDTKVVDGQESTMIKLKEVGDASAKVYQWDKTYDDENERIYGFFSDSDEVYNVVIDEIEPEDPYYYKGSDPVSKMKRISVRFYVVGEDPDDEDYEKVVNKGELFKVMATVVDILKFELKLRPYIKAIEFKPSKRKTQDRARLELYKRFFKNFYPNTEFKNYGDEVIAILKK